MAALAAARGSLAEAAGAAPSRGRFLSDRGASAYLGGMMTTPATLDRTALERLQRLGGSALLRQMLELFREGAAQRLAAARVAAEAGEPAGVAREAHALISSAGNVGAAELMARACALEQAALAGAADLPALLAALEEAYARLEAPLAAAEEELAR